MRNRWDIHWKDYYQILQVHPTAEQEVIKAAYDRLARKYHPDVNQEPSSAQKMVEINEAYEVLGDLNTRRLYHPVWLQKKDEKAIIVKHHREHQPAVELMNLLELMNALNLQFVLPVLSVAFRLGENGQSVW